MATDIPYRIGSARQVALIVSGNSGWFAANNADRQHYSWHVTMIDEAKLPVAAHRITTAGVPPSRIRLLSLFFAVGSGHRQMPRKREKKALWLRAPQIWTLHQIDTVAVTLRWLSSDGIIERLIL